MMPGEPQAIGSAAALVAKHLPPSASTLRLLDVNGAFGAPLAALRPDLAVIVDAAPHGEDQFDAVTIYGALPGDDLLRAALAALRPGGRLIVYDVNGDPSRALVWQLQAVGFTRILVEELLPVGALMRGEKPHVTDDTLARIERVAAVDAAQPDFRGRYLHLLVRQTPNKPVWALKPDDPVEWQAVALAGEGEAVLLAFSSLPNAVAFMQPAVLAGSVSGVNKVGKFRREVADALAPAGKLLINPRVDVLNGRDVVLVPVERTLAEAPDE